MPSLTLQQAYELAVAHQDAGRLREAESLYRQILAHQPGHAPTVRMLGLLAFQCGRSSEALELIHRAIALNPHDSTYHSNLGVVLASRKQLDEAIAAFREALARQPGDSQTLINLANALQEKAQFEEAIRVYRQVLEISPDSPEAHYNFGRALHETSRLDEAINSYEQALRLRPNYAEAHFNLGNARRDKGELDAALAAYEQALAARPHYTEARWNMGLVLLLRGDFERGWPTYEARRQMKNLWDDRAFTQPFWDGSDLNGRRILLHAEQGLGDAIQFVRYAPMVAARGGTVIVQCQAQLKRLLEGQLRIAQVVSREEPLPPYDLYCPMMSLPRLMGTTIKNIPAEVPYLRADPDLVRNWEGRLAAEPPALKVGLVWAGNPLPPENRKRTVGLDQMAALAAVPNVRFYSLQKGDAAAQAKSPPCGMDLIDWTAELADMADTAALVTNLDVVITCDTSVAHLAGALGIPVWVALPYAADWRWLLDRNDSPWYPTMRLFRQPSPGEWKTPLSQIAEHLSLL